jgi:hypothetical protein
MRVSWKQPAKWAFRDRFRSGKTKCRPLVEGLEGRQLLATVNVNVSQVVRTVDTQVLGVNVDWWDSNLNTSQTQQMVQAAGLTMFRFPGGSSSDDFHFNAPPGWADEKGPQITGLALPVFVAQSVPCRRPPFSARIGSARYAWRTSL